MTCLGVDLGNEHCRVGVARVGGVDICLNEESSRETPAVITFGSRERSIGATCSMMNLKNSVWQIKRLVGRKFNDPEVQTDVKLMPCAVTEDRDGWPVMHVEYRGEHRSFKATELLGMILAHLKQMAERNLGSPTGDCVIAIPAFMSDLQRRCYVDAARIAGLNPLKLIHETTAAALSYGLYKPDLPSSEELYVVFVDVGHAHTQVAVAAFRKGQVEILSYAFDRCLGGRDFDEVLFTHFAAVFAEKYNINVMSNSRACQRLRAACEGLKKILSANPEAPISIECLMDEKDVKGFMTREEFEKLSAPLLHRFRHVCERAVADSELAVDSISAVEVIGSGSRVPAISRVLFSAFRKEASRTLNASETVARGCALQGAMLSPTFKVKQFEVNDYFLFPIALSWTGPAAFEYGHDEPASTSSGIVPQVLPNATVFARGISFPCSKELTFSVSGASFEARALYADTTDLPANTPNPFATFRIGPMDCRKTDQSQVELLFCVNAHGVLKLTSATLVEDEEEQGGTRKRKLRYAVPVAETTIKELSESQLETAVESEFEMQLQDRIEEETKEAKNALEALVYNLRNKFYGNLQEYATELEKNDLLKKLEDTENWLYGEGNEETKSVYASRLEALQQRLSMLESREQEEQARDRAFAALENKIDELKNAVASGEMTKSNAKKVRGECTRAEQWVKDAKRRQERVPKFAKATVSAAEIQNKRDALDRYYSAYRS